MRGVAALNWSPGHGSGGSLFWRFGGSNGSEEKNRGVSPHEFSGERVIVRTAWLASEPFTDSNGQR